MDKKEKNGFKTSYSHFVKKVREDERNADPNRVVNLSEFSKKCSAIWNNMTNREKEPFLRKAGEERRKCKSVSKDVKIKSNKKSLNSKIDSKQRDLTEFLVKLPVISQKSKIWQPCAPEQSHRKLVQKSILDYIGGGPPDDTTKLSKSSQL